MLIGGLQKTTLIDYPDKVACIVFTLGCNFRCGFCHNPELVENINGKNGISEDVFFDFLQKRKKVLDGVVITGGEPLLQKDIKNFIIRIRDKGFLVKLDTNGTFPDKLKELIDLKLVDYVAMDVKTVLEKYLKVVNAKGKEQDVLRSIKTLLKNNVDYEFRTTVVEGLHSKEDLINVAKLIKGAPKYFLQKFVAAPKLLDKSFEMRKSLSRVELEDVCDVAGRYVRVCEIRQ
jgi:pyruvate formate lyase activating enzyme